jgi:hypothetical protein
MNIELLELFPCGIILLEENTTSINNDRNYKFIYSNEYAKLAICDQSKISEYDMISNLSHFTKLKNLENVNDTQSNCNENLFMELYINNDNQEIKNIKFIYNTKI